VASAKLSSLEAGAWLTPCLRYGFVLKMRSQFHALLYRARQRKGLRVFALGQRLRHFVDHVTHTAGTALGAGQEGRLVCGACRPADAHDQYAAGSGPSHHRAEALCHERVSPSWWQSTGVSHGTRAPVEPYSVSASRSSCRPMWRGSGGWNSPNPRLVPQCPNPHFRRLPMREDMLHHIIRWHVIIFVNTTR
jgi:hypothetical protein